MSLYAESGVDIHAGDNASKAAYAAAKTTFPTRSGLIGQPFVMEGGFAGALDMGDYLLIQNDDGTGTKAEIAERTGQYDTLGHDLCAMVADDAICVGAEVISLTNTFDVPNIDHHALSRLANGLADACREQKIVIPGGEIAEVGSAVNKIVWNATAVGVVKKEKFITGRDIAEGDIIIGLQGRVLRSNGVSLARKICQDTFGDEWHNEPYDEKHTWGDVLLTPSKIYHRLLLNTVLGDFETPRPHAIKGLCHITGGGIPGNLPRVLPTGMGATIDTPHAPHEALKKLQQLGNVPYEECYAAWHSGSAMMLVVAPENAAEVCQTINAADKEVDARPIGSIIRSDQITVTCGYSGQNLSFSIT